MHKVKIKGVIVSDSDKWIYDWFEMEATSPKDVAKELELANNFDVDVEINSGGGNLYAGSEIYTMLMEYKGKVNVKIVGIAGSAASIIAMTGDNIAMSPTGQIMIHNVWSYAEGDYKDMEKEAEVLKGFNESVANAYLLRTGKTKEELLVMMDKETWMNAREAKENGFIDEIMFDKDKKIAASQKSILIPNEIIEKMRNYLAKSDKNNSVETEKTVEINVLKQKLNLLKLREVK